jgi:transcriptional regulator with XRE-family HTH domain
MRRRLGNALRRHREEANVRLEQAAAAIECSPAKVSRVENGISAAKAVEVHALLRHYGVNDPARHAKLENWTKLTKSSAWWHDEADLVDEDESRFLATETEAARVLMYCSVAFPTILQTPDYARAYLHARRPELDESNLYRLERLRTSRQAYLLASDSDFQLDVIIDESVLTRRFGAHEVQDTQLLWLSRALEGAEMYKDRVALRVVPLRAGPPRRATSDFAIFEPRDPQLDPTTARVEATLRSQWYDDETSTEILTGLYTELRGASLPADESQRLLHKAIRSSIS